MTVSQLYQIMCIANISNYQLVLGKALFFKVNLCIFSHSKASGDVINGFSPLISSVDLLVSRLASGPALFVI